MTVQDNYLHDLGWNAVLVGNEGQALHSGWAIDNNVIADVAAYAVELTNAENSNVTNNQITGGDEVLGEADDDSQDAILVQAQIHTGAGLTVSTVDVSGNTISGTHTRAGIELLAWDSTGTLTVAPSDYDRRSSTVASNSSR